MKIKRFRAPDMRAALQQVRAEMGPDAVILQARPVRGRGVWAWFGRGPRWVEVTAAWDGDRPSPRDPGPAGRGDGTGHSPRRLDVAVGDGPLAPPAVTSPARPAPDSRTAGRTGPGPAPGLQALPPAVPAAGPLQPPAGAGPEGDPGDRARAIPRILPPPGPPLGGVVVLVGPTGAGKTTTVAKLAARAVLDEGRPVALLAADTYRLGATAALGAYAELLGLPLTVAYAPGEAAAWREALGEAAPAGPLALVDTAGRNLLLPEVAVELAALLAAVRPARVLLVLPATLAGAEAAALVAVGRRLGVTDLVLTKLDECLDPAAVLARAGRWGLPLALVGCGQRVPDDLLAGSAEALEAWLARSGRPQAGGGTRHGFAGAGVG
ncbi:flagellar biosynthesis protein FlhF [Thermaerobacter litoralis]